MTDENGDLVPQTPSLFNKADDSVGPTAAELQAKQAEYIAREQAAKQDAQVQEVNEVNEDTETPLAEQESAAVQNEQVNTGLTDQDESTQVAEIEAHVETEGAFDATAVEAETFAVEAEAQPDSVVEPVEENTATDETDEITEVKEQIAAAEAKLSDTDTEAANIADAVEANSESSSLEELKERQAELERQINEKVNADKAVVIAQIKTVAETYGITAEDLVAALGGLKKKTRNGSPAKPKYRDPATQATWSGRGKPPHWIKDQDRSKYLIAETTEAV